MLGSRPSAISALALALTIFVTTGCRSDAGMSKDIVGSWSWNPRQKLPPSEIENTGFPTPELEAVKFTTDGQYVFVQRIPGYDQVPESWHEWKGSWGVEDGRLAMRAGREAEDHWLAKRRASGWVRETDKVMWERTFELVELKSHELQLHTLAIGDFDRTFRRVEGMPERPEVR